MKSRWQETSQLTDVLKAPNYQESEERKSQWPTDLGAGLRSLSSEARLEVEQGTTMPGLFQPSRPGHPGCPAAT